MIRDQFNEEIKWLLQQTVSEIERFLEEELYLLDQIPLEDCDEVVNSFTTAVVTLQSLIRLTKFKYDENGEQLDLNRLLQEIIRDGHFEELKIETEKSLPTVHINRLRIRELFYCLLSNARRSRATKVMISFSKDSQFTITDNRPKMLKHDKQHLFYLLYADERNQTKSNLDLFMAKSIVDFYEGDIFVSINKDKTVIKLKFPANLFK